MIPDKSSGIAVFDSGLGGISVLKELNRIMPGEDLIYYGDSANAPYGTKTQAQIQYLCDRVMESLVARNIKAVVIACNTATSMAAERLRQEYPGLIIVGIEPAVKPAALCCRHPSVLVLATDATVHGKKLLDLVSRYSDKAEIRLIPAQKIVEFVEAGDRDPYPSQELKTYLNTLLSPYTDSTDAVVLGCTHFPFVSGTIKTFFPENVRIFDGSTGTAERTRQLLYEKGLLNSDSIKGRVIIHNSRPESLELAKQLFYL